MNLTGSARWTVKFVWNGVGALTAAGSVCRSPAHGLSLNCGWSAVKVTREASLWWHYTTSRKVAGSRPNENDFFFSNYLILPAAPGPGVYSACNRNTKQKAENEVVWIRHADRVTPLYPQKLALTSLTSGGRSVGIVHSRTQATEVFS
jgi:hypothetical protein